MNPMLTKIISGSRSGAEQAALDAAVSLDVARGGWIPGHREDGTAGRPAEYNLREMPDADGMQSAARNIRDADGTLIVSKGPLSAILEQIHQTVHRQSKPFHHIDLKRTPAFRAAAAILDWIDQYDLQSLYVTGPEESQAPSIYGHTRKILETLYYLDIVKGGMPSGATAKNRKHRLPAESDIPETIDAAADLIIREMPLRDRVLLSNFTYPELAGLQPTLGLYIRKKLAAWSVSNHLMDACLRESNRLEFSEYSAAAVIIEKIWQKLRKSHKLRVVK